MENFEKAAVIFQERSTEKCYASNSENVNGFIQCMSKSIEKIEGIQKHIEGTMMYTAIKSAKSDQEGKDKEFTSNATAKIIEQKFNELARSLE